MKTDFQTSDTVLISEGAFAGTVAEVTKTNPKNFSSCVIEDAEKPLCNMTTCEIVILADTDGKTYVSGGMRYNKVLGLHDNLGRKWPADAFGSCNELIHLKGWHRIHKKKITKEEIEKKLGFEIEIVEENK